MLDNAIPCPLLNAAQKNPHSPAIAWGSRKISFLQLNQYVNAAVRSLKERDIRPGHRVALLSDNSIEMVIVLLGLWRLGAVAVPLNPRHPTQLLKDLFVTLTIRSVIYARSALAQGFKIPLFHFEITDLIVFEHKEVFLALDQEKTRVGPDQPAVIVLTSGSSGKPKAAVLSYGSLYFNAMGSSQAIPLSLDDKWLLSLPLYHVSGLGIIFRCLIANAQVVIAAREDVLRFVHDGRVSHVSFVPVQLFNLLEVPGFKRPEGLKAVLMGGSAISKRLLQCALSHGLPVYLSYGMTEMGSQVATGKLEDDQKPCARVLHYRELLIGPDGEIHVRGEVLFQGYIEGAGLTLPVDRDGWFHTGDLGSLDQFGCLTVLGRKDDMFISGGENIHPVEIENALMKIPSILSVAVVAVEDDAFGQRPVAFIQWISGQEPLSHDQIIGHLKHNLPNFKLPAAYFPWPSMIDGENLKVDKKYLRDLARERMAG